MEKVPPTIRFCSSADGTGIAFGVHGGGPPLVRVATWMTHLQHDWESPLWRHWLDALAEGHTLVRYDERGSEVSDRDVTRFSVDAWVEDLEAVVDAAGLERFSLLGMSNAAAVAIAFAARHPERVSHLVLYGGFAQGRLRHDPSPQARAEAEAELMVALIRTGWGKANPAFRSVFTSLFVPGATNEQMTWFDEMQRISASPETAALMRLARQEVDVVDLLAHVVTPTLVLHAQHDAVAPFELGRGLATAIWFCPSRGTKRAPSTSCWRTSPRGRCSGASSMRSCRPSPVTPRRRAVPRRPGLRTRTRSGPPTWSWPAHATTDRRPPSLGARSEQRRHCCRAEPQ